MSFLSWIAVGLIAGLLARAVVKHERTGCVYTIAVGVIGALIGGALMKAAGKGDKFTEFSLSSVLVAALGSIILLLVLQAIGGRTSATRRRR